MLPLLQKVFHGPLQCLEPSCLATHRHLPVHFTEGAWIGYRFVYGFQLLLDINVLKAGSMSVPPPVPGKALLSEERYPLPKLWWLRRETDPVGKGSQERLTRWWVWVTLKERGEVGKHARRRELFRNLAKQEKHLNSPRTDLSEEPLGSER